MILTVVGSVFLTRNEGFGMEEGAIDAGLDFVNDIRFKVNVKRAGNVFASSSFCLHNHTLKIFWGGVEENMWHGERGTREVRSATYQRRRLRNQYQYERGNRVQDGRQAKRWHDMSFIIARGRQVKNLRSNRAQLCRVPLGLTVNFRPYRRVAGELKLTASITNLDT